MAQKTWLPGLLRWLDRLCRYIQENRRFLDRFLTTEEAQAALDATLVACQALHDVVIPLLPPET